MTRAPSPLPAAAWGLFAAVTVFSLVLVSRSQVDGDAVQLLLRGWALAHEGTLVPYGNPLSAGAGGYEPGPMTSLLVGLPLLVWSDYRAPALLVLAFHLASWVLLDRVMREAVSRKERLLFFVLYGLSPWRMFFSGFTWNPNWLFLAGAVHLWASWRQRERPAFWPSAALALALGCAVQLHPSTVILGFATVLLLLRGCLRLHWGGVAAGTAVVLASLVPWALAAAADPSILPGHGSEVERTVVRTLHNALRGVSYWCSLPSLALPTRVTLFDFGPALGDTADRILRPVHYVVSEFLFEATALPAAIVLAGAVRRRRRKPVTPRRWLKAYAGAAFVGGLVSFVLIPTTIMMWQLLIVFHAALLLLVLRLAEMRGGRKGAFARGAIAVLIAGFVWMDVAAALASPAYRRGGYAAMVAFVSPDHPMVRGLGIDRHATPVDPERPPTQFRFKPTWRGGTRGAQSLSGSASGT
jgi:hypothetical protein